MSTLLVLALKHSKKIDPNSSPNSTYDRFYPIQINGNTFRLHWLVSFKKNGMKYFFCDSKRPGFLAGPYNSTQAFINEYEQYRGRRITAHRELRILQKEEETKISERRKLNVCQVISNGITFLNYSAIRHMPLLPRFCHIEPFHSQRRSRTPLSHRILP